ncbi:MAG: hypothetical protein SOX71_01895 [Candidatus Faecousia sp.]|nr:hypothetical protein [Candidatus Faecousia sp.]
MNEQPHNSPEEIYREARKQIVRSAFLALAALGVIMFACYAWFVSSGTVTGTVGSVRIDGSSFELASVGPNVGKWDETILADNAKYGTSQDFGDRKLVVTGEENDILWQISDDSHLENGAAKTGISPGSSGKLEFYVIPKRDGELRLKVSVTLAPLKRDGKQITMEDDKTLNWLLRGHFLFSYECQNALGYNSENTPTLISYENGSFKLTFQNAVTDQPIPVTLYWKWPEFLRDIIYNEKDGSAVKTWMTRNPSHFFYNENKPISKPNFDENFTSQFREYNNYYNNADEYIGSNVYSLVLRLTAEEF